MSKLQIAKEHLQDFEERLVGKTIVFTNGTNWSWVVTEVSQNHVSLGTNGDSRITNFVASTTELFTNVSRDSFPQYLIDKYPEYFI